MFDIVLFYKYCSIADPDAVIAFLEHLCGPKGLGLTGRVLVAHEGINGTLGGCHGVDATGTCHHAGVYCCSMRWLVGQLVSVVNVAQAGL
jgi:predicted sulfurtransferase